MKSLIVITLALSSALSFAEDAAAPAKPAPKPAAKMDPAKAFAKMDTNGDKAISLDEFKASPRGQKAADKAEAAFKKLDTNGDGSVNMEEFSTPPVKKAK